MKYIHSQAKGWVGWEKDLNGTAGKALMPDSPAKRQLPGAPRDSGRWECLCFVCLGSWDRTGLSSAHHLKRLLDVNTPK